MGVLLSRSSQGSGSVCKREYTERQGLRELLQEVPPARLQVPIVNVPGF